MLIYRLRKAEGLGWQYYTTPQGAVNKKCASATRNYVRQNTSKQWRPVTSSALQEQADPQVSEHSAKPRHEPEYGESAGQHGGSVVIA
ncbi:hypothetical protein RB195_020386 [Necator americanus]|uniref:Uncharacterized protein n=1 Tax=Necator americanus TaxID=51031 RepID=A0ABR1CJY9_NECAM